MSEKITAIVFDGLTGETIERDLNEEELEERKLVLAQVSEEEAAEASKVKARKSALKKLAALGLTEEEIASL
jgi:hypothetical protein